MYSVCYALWPFWLNLSEGPLVQWTRDPVPYALPRVGEKYKVITRRGRYLGGSAEQTNTEDINTQFTGLYLHW